MQYNRLNDPNALLNLIKALDKRISGVETRGTGAIGFVGADGVELSIGVQPDGQAAIIPFIGDTTPPPIATSPDASSGPGFLTVTWDGLFVNGETMPLDFEHLNVVGSKIVNGVPVLDVAVGIIRNPMDACLVGTEVAAVGETWEFTFVSEDYNGNLSAISASSERVTQKSFAADVLIDDALSGLQQDFVSAQSAAASAQQAANDAQAAADTIAGDLSATDEAVAAAQLKADQAFSNAVTAAEAAGTAQDTADGKNRSWYQDNQPAGTSHKVGDSWTDTNDGYKLRTWNGSIWQTTQDSALAQITAESKGRTYTQDVTPPVEARNDKNLWIDTSAGPGLYVTKYWNGTIWTALKDKDAAAAQTTADAKGETIYSSTEPAAAKRLTQNTWVDTSGGLNINKRWDGNAWIVSVDSRIPSTAAAVTAVDSRVSSVSAYLNVVSQDLQDAQIVMDTQGVTLTQSTVPSSEFQHSSNLWIDISLGTDKAVTKYWDGNAWMAVSEKAAKDALTTAEAKGETIWSSSAPAASKQLVQNQWIDTTGGLNIVKRWNTATGTWVVASDQRIDTTAAAVTAVDSRVTGVSAAAGSAIGSVDSRVTSVSAAASGQISTVDSRVTGVSAAAGSAIGSVDSRVTSVSAAASGQISTVDSRVTGVSAAAASGIAGATTAAGYAAKATSYSLNPSFDDWTGTSPASYSTWTSNPVKDTTNHRIGAYGLQYVAALASDQRGISFGPAIAHAPNLEYFTVEVEFMLLSGTSLQGSGVLLDWAGLTPSRSVWKFADSVSGTPALNKWYRLSKVIRRSTSATGTWTSMGGYLMANYSEVGTLTAKTMTFDWLNVRPSTAEEILSYTAPTTQDLTAVDTRVTGVSAAAGSLLSTLDTRVTGVSAAASSGISTVDSRVSGVSATAGSLLSSLDTKVSGVSAAASSGISTVDSRVTGVSAAAGSLLSTLDTKVSGVSAAANTQIGTVDTRVTGVSATAGSLLSTLDTKVTSVSAAASGQISTVDSRVTGVSAAAGTAVSSLDTKVSGVSAAASTQIGTVDSRVTGVSSAAGSLLSSLDTRVTGVSAAANTQIGTVDSRVTGVSAAAGTAVTSLDTKVTGVSAAASTQIGNVDSRVTGVSSTAGSLISTLDTRVTGVSAAAGTAITTVDTKVSGVSAAASSQIGSVDSRVTGVSSTAGSLISTLDTRVTGVSSSASTQIGSVDTRVTGVSAAAGSAITNVDARVTGVSAAAGTAVSTLDTKVTGVSAAASTQIGSVDTRVTGVSATAGSLLSTLDTRVTGVSAAAGSAITSVDTRVSGVSAAASSEATAKASAAQAAAIAAAATDATNKVTVVDSKVSSVSAAVTSVDSRVTGVSAAAGTLVTSLDTKVTGVSAAATTKIGAVDTRVTGVSAAAGSALTTVDARVTGVSSAAGSAISTVDARVTGVSSAAGTAIGTVDTKVSGVSAAASTQIGSVDSRVTGVSAAAGSAISNVDTRVTGVSAAAGSAIISVDTKVAGVSAAATTKIGSVDSRVTGVSAAASSEATSKANAAQAAAIAAAATDAQNKANAAQQAAITASAATAQQKADDAQQAAIEAAELDAEAKAATAKSEAISAAATTAQQKADTAKQQAIDAAAITAQLKADGAEQAAIDAAAITAQQKADTAKQAAIDAAAITAQAKADTAKSQAISAAATDAQTRATEAKTEAIEAAATDATTKSDAAQRIAIQAQAYQLNPSFEDWTGTIPVSYTTFVTNPTKETTTVRTGKNAVRFNCTDTTTQRGLQFDAALAHAPYFEYVTVELDVRLDSGTSFGGSGVLVDWVGMTGGNRSTLSLAAEIPTPVTGRWYRVVKVLRKPATATGTFTKYSAWLMGQYSAGMGTMSVKNVIFDWINVRPSTTEEITAFGTPASISALSDTVNTKTKSWFQPGQPPLTGNTTGDLWFDTDAGNKTYIWNGAWTSAQDTSISAAATSASAAMTAANGKNKLVYSTADPSGTSGYVAGDIWFKRDATTGVVSGQWEFRTSPVVEWRWMTLDSNVIAYLNAAKITTGTLDAGRIGTYSLTANKIAVGDFTNLFSSPQFANITGGVSMLNGSTLYAGVDVPVGLAAEIGARDHTSVDKISVRPGDQFYVEYTAKKITGTASLTAGIWITSISGGVSAGWSQWSGLNGGSPTFIADLGNGWARYSIKPYVNLAWAGVSYAQLYFQISQFTPYTTSYAVSDVVWRRRSAGELLVDGTIKAGSAIIENGAIGNAHIGDLAVGTAEIQDAAVKTAKIEDLAVSTAKIANLAVDTAQIKDGAVTNLKVGALNADRIQSGLISATVLDAETIRTKLLAASKIDADDIIASNTITGTLISGTAIDGKTITGAIIQTDSTPVSAARGIKLTSTELAGWDTTGQKNFSLTSNGTLALRGAMESGSTITGTAITGGTVTGSTVQTESTPSRGIKMTSTELVGYDGTGQKNFSLTSAGTLAIRGAIESGSTITGSTLTGNTIQTEVTASRGIKLTTTELAGWDTNGQKNFSLTSTGTLAIRGAIESGSTITGATLTGNTIQTEVTASRGIKLTTTELAGYDGAGVKNFSLTSGGTLALRGALQSGSSIQGASVSASGIYTNASPTAGVKLADTGIKAYNGSGALTFHLDATTGLLEVPGLKASSITSAMISATAIDGKTITGATMTGGLIQTDNTAIDTAASRGIKLTTSGLYGYDGSGNKTFNLTSAGTLSIKGSILAGSTITGAGFTAGGAGLETNVAVSRGVKLQDTGITAYDASGNLTFKVDAATGLIEAPGLKANSISSAMISATALDSRIITGSTIQTTPTAARGIKLTATEFAGYDNTGFKTFSLLTDGTLSIKGAITSGSTITGATVTGSTIQTEVTASRGIKLTSTELAGYDGTGQKNLSLTSAGALYLRGEIKSGSTIEGAKITGTQGIETSTFATTGVKINNAGIKAYDGANNLTFSVDASTGLVKAPGLEANSIKGDMVASGAITTKHLTVGDFTNLATIDELNGTTIASYGQTQIVGGYNKLVTDSSTFFMFTEKKGPIPFKLGDKLRYEFIAKATSATTVNFTVFTYDAADAYTTSTSSALNVGTTDTLISGVLEITNANMATAQKFVFGLSSVANKGIQIRAVKVIRQSDATTIADGAIKTQHVTTGTLDGGVITAGSLSSVQIKAKSITVDDLVVTSTDNLVVEADFGNNGSSWDLAPAYKWIIPDRGRGGLPAYRVTGGTVVVTTKNLANLIKVDEKNRYRAQISVRSTEALAADKVQMVLRCYTTATVYTDIVAVSSPALVADTWTSVKGMVPELPAGTQSVEVLLNVQNSAIGTWTEIDYVSLTRAMDANLVVDGAITAASLAAEAVQAKHISSQSIMASAMNANAIDGMIITGATIRTSSSAVSGIKLDIDGLRAYDGTNSTPTFDLTSSNGKVKMVGRIRTGLDNEVGATLLPASESSDGITSGMFITPTNLLTGQTSAGVWVTVNNPATAQNLNLRALNNGAIKLWGPAIADSIGDGASFALRPNAAGASFLDVTNMTFNAAPTTSAAANALIATSPAGRIYRSTSSRRYKADIQDWNPSYRALELTPRSWVDRSPIDPTAPLTRYYGYIAEEVEEVMPEFVSYNEFGEPESVTYDRMPSAATIAMLKDIDRRLKAAGL